MKLPQIAIFMMLLIVSIPAVFAQELSLIRYSGKDAANGYAKTNDEFTVKALVKIPGEDIIDTNQVRFYLDDAYTPFDTCVPSTGGYYECTLVEPEFESYENLPFTVEVVDDEMNILGSESRTLILDNNAPKIKEFLVDTNVSSGKFTVSYTIEDYGLTYGNTAECSGIKVITIKAGQKQINQSANPGDCTVTNTIDFIIDNPGTVQLCIAAKDYTNFASSPSCAQVTVDKSPPSIGPISILDSDGYNITHVHGGEERTASLTALIRDDGEVDITSVKADLSQISPTLSDDMSPDDIDSNLYSWTGITVSEITACSLSITATDTLGNTKKETINCAIKADDTPPTVLGLAAQKERDGVPVYGYNTPLIIEFEDKDNDGREGIGMSARKAYLDLSALGMDVSAQADDCVQEGNVWKCAWYLRPPAGTPEKTYSVTLQSQTSDNLNNEITDVHEYSIIYDEIGPRIPEILSYKVITGESGETYEGGIIAGYTAEYKVRSAKFSTATANFSDIGGDDYTDAIDCEGNETCTFHGIVQQDGPYNATITFEFQDDAGNSARNSTTLYVYGVENKTGQKYWNVTGIECSPRLIDRATASLTPPYLSCKINLKTSRSDINTLSITGPSSPTDCTGDIGAINDVYVTNNFEGSKTPFIFFVLNPQDYEVDKLQINCPIYVRSTKKTGQAFYVTKDAQKLPVNITAEFYNSPMGQMGKNIDNKIKTAKDNAFAQQDWLGELNKILKYVQTACQLKNILANLIGVGYLVTLALAGTSVALKSVSPLDGGASEKSVAATAAIFCNVEESLGETYDSIKEVLDTVCSIANCEAVGGDSDIGGVAGYLGGGVPWCSDIKEFLGGIWPEAESGLRAASGGAGKGNVGSYSGTIDVKDSLIMSVACLCLPGIIYNVEKMRQIYCFKAVCYNDLVKEAGYPTSLCEGQYNYLWCAFVIGEIFSLLPFAAFFDKLINAVVEAISNPIIAVGVIIGAACQTLCTNIAADASTSPTYIACAAYKVFAVIAEAVNAVVMMAKAGSSYWKPVGNQYCERMEDIEDDE